MFRQYSAGMSADGYIGIPDIVVKMKQKATEAEIRNVVACDAKVIIACYDVL